MKEELLTRLDVLSDKLGVAMETLWRALLKQAPIQAISDLFLLVFVLIMILLGSWFTYKMGTKSEDDKYDVGMVVGAIFTIIMIIFSLVCINNLPSILSGFFNPEYWALREIMTYVN